MKKPLRQRIGDAIKVLKGEPLPIELPPRPTLEITTSEIKTLSAWCIYNAQYIYGPTPKSVIRERAEWEMALELGKALLREKVIQFREDDKEPALHASVRVVMPVEGE